MASGQASSVQAAMMPPYRTGRFKAYASHNAKLGTVDDGSTKAKSTTAGIVILARRSDD
jgi:hypothetical protein